MRHIDPRALCAQTFAGRPAGLARLADRRTTAQRSRFEPTRSGSNTASKGRHMPRAPEIPGIGAMPGIAEADM
jgi:hypothetical protein